MTECTFRERLIFLQGFLSGVIWSLLVALAAWSHWWQYV